MPQAHDHTFLVQGMTCGGCERTVREAVEELDGVVSTTADRTNGELRVRGDIDRTAVRQAIDDAGYELAPPST